MSDLAIVWSDKWSQYIECELQLTENKLLYLLLFEEEVKEFLRGLEFKSAYWTQPFNRMSPSFEIVVEYKLEDKPLEVKLLGNLTEKSLFLHNNIEYLEQKLGFHINEDGLSGMGTLFKHFGVISLIDAFHLVEN